MAVNEVPIYDICANGGDALTCSNHGSCQNGACVCTDGYTGRDCSLPPGGFNYPNPIPKARATKFANLDGSDGQLEMTTCFGNFPGGQWVSKEFLPAGVTGIAAVNPTLYGSRFAFGKPKQYTSQTVTGSYSGVGQSCGQCFNITKGAQSSVVMVVNRCGGFCTANSAVGPCSVNGPTSTDCGYCVTPVTTNTTVGCSCMSKTAIQTNGWCDLNSQAHHCDHCAANDHPHFDLDTDTLNHICGDNNAGVCDLDSFQWVECGGIVAQPDSFPNGATPNVLPSNAVPVAGSTKTPTGTVKPPVAGTTKPETTQAPTVSATPAPTVQPTVQPTPVPTVKATVQPTPVPTVKATVQPTPVPTVKATVQPTPVPTQPAKGHGSSDSTPAPTQQATPTPTQRATPTPVTPAPLPGSTPAPTSAPPKSATPRPKTPCRRN